MIKSSFEIMAEYNALMNQRICDSISTISNDILWQDQKAFFGSILGTLNHLMVGDLIWLNRFNQHPSYPKGFKSLIPLKDLPLPTMLTQVLYEDKESFSSNRKNIDQIIIQFVKELNESDYLSALTYKNTEGESFSKPFSMLLQHLFNHQTHHRGQVSALLTQMNIDVGETDLLMLIPNTDY